MDVPANFKPTIVLIDDDSAIRSVIKGFLYKDFKIYSADNGVEGLGFVFIVKPQIIIIDATLPKYSGMEITQYISTNERILQEKISVVVMYENEKIPNLPANFKAINKKDKNFLEKLFMLVEGQNPKNKFQTMTGDLVIRTGNRIDVLAYKILTAKNFFSKFFNIFRWIFWLFLQLLESIYLTLFYVVSGKAKDENIEQYKQDDFYFRIKTYPTLITFLTTIIFVCIQVILFTVGGIVIFNQKIESIFS